MKLYIAIHDDVPDDMAPLVVAHTILMADIRFSGCTIPVVGWVAPFPLYDEWFDTSFRKCIVRVNSKEFAKISAIPYTCLGHEATVRDKQYCCAIPSPVLDKDLPNVLKFAKLWKPK